ncbi:MAG TPA: sugar transferase, partial [Desulfitobacteriaceae bacterium]|nr:sugar transferase [Desulfitobacteriaceae bacterium]
VSNLTKLHDYSDYLWILIIYIPVWIFTMASRGMYNKTTFYYVDRIARNVILASLLSGLCIGAMLYFVKEVSTSRLFIGFFIFYSMVLPMLERYAFSMIYRRNKSFNAAPQLILVCSHDTYSLFSQYLKKTQIRYNIVGVVQVGQGKIIKNVKNLGALDDLEEILKKNIVDEVILSMPRDYFGGVKQYVHLCEQMGITVRIIMNSYDLQMSHVQISMLGPLPMVTFHTVTLNPLQKAIKRSMDIAGASVGLLVTLIASLFIVPAIKLDSPGPIIFKQKRVGRYGRVFDFYKFRTMCADAETKKEELQALNEHKDGLMFKIKEDPRITRIGAILRKTSLDELPQFYNVLKGDMSLVGTRPPTPDEVARYDLEHYRRISIKPGLTGMWQVSGRSNILDFDEVVALDTKYIDKWSIWLDVRIILKTVFKVLKRESAY